MSDDGVDADASRSRDRRSEALLIVGLIVLEFGAGLTYVLTGNLWLAVGIALVGVVAVAVGMRLLASTHGLTIREAIQDAADRARRDPGNAFERFSSRRIWIPLCIVTWGFLGFAVDDAETPMRVMSALGVAIVGGFGGSLLRPRRERMLSDWSDWGVILILGGLALADGISSLAGNGALSEWSMGPVSLALATWVFGGAVLDARRPIASDEQDLTS